MPYRADIDGLRALAVLAVLFFHAGVPLVGGGYVGVDVFFVISGYLITALILHEQDAGAFSLTSFYHRRIRRILPALFVMICGCAIAGWFLLAPADYARLGQNMAGAALSFSNLQFWLTAGYFDTPAAEKPLLHTWSLGVEEQFYMVFPIYLNLVRRIWPSKRLPLTAAFCLASFAFASIAAFRDPNGAFYLPHARLWELLVGGLLAMGVAPAPTRATLRTIAATLGLALIIGPVILYSGDTVFPGATALPPTIGTALVIWSGTGGNSVVGRTLAGRPLVFLGKISYSLYLWHFPLLAFGLYVGLGEMSPATTAMLLAAAFVLAVLSWHFVEQPARRAGGRLRWRTVASSAACGVILLVFAGLTLQVSGGFAVRLREGTLQLIAGRSLRNPDRLACFVSSAEIALDKLCVIGDATATPDFVLWGDSHAETLRGALGAAAAATGHAGLFAGQVSCPPLIGATRPQKPECRVINEALFRAIVETPSIDTVVMAARWGWWAESLPYKREGGTPVTLALLDTPASTVAGNHYALAAGLEQTVAALLAAGKQVWLVGPVPEVGYDVPRYFFLRSLGFEEGLEIAPTMIEFHARQAFVLDLLGDLGRRYPVGTIWPHERLCDDDGCAIVRDGGLLYSDDDHLSVFGARSIAGLFAPIFD